MNEIINSLESAVSNKNWYGALFIALSIPDICGKIDAIHNGSGAREAVSNFHFIAPIEGMMIHCNKSNDQLQLQIDIFCSDIIKGARQWLSEVYDDENKKRKIEDLLKIHVPDSEGSIKF